MKKSFLLLPFIALGLTACNSGSDASQTSAEVTSVGAPAWQNPEIQQVEMPSSMTQQPTYQVPQPIQTVPQPTYTPPSAQMGAEMIGNCQVVRDSANTPIYSQIQKGCYTQPTYTVGKHDTVFLVAYLSGKPVAEIARLNGLSAPYQLKLGQVLRLQ